MDLSHHFRGLWDPLARRLRDIMSLLRYSPPNLLVNLNSKFIVGRGLNKRYCNSLKRRNFPGPTSLCARALDATYLIFSGKVSRIILQRAPYVSWNEVSGGNNVHVTSIEPRAAWPGLKCTFFLAIYLESCRWRLSKLGEKQLHSTQISD